MRDGRSRIALCFVLATDLRTAIGGRFSIERIADSRENHDPERPRKLLRHRRELDAIAGRAQERGLTLVPTRIYFAGSHAKVEIALARGKDLYDKRQAIRERESKRDIERAVREARR